MSPTSYLHELNAPQREAVEHTEGPLLIVAGAGAGKTRTLIYRIFHLIQNGVAPHHILAVTFTNKAAAEMGERITTLMETSGVTSTPYQITERPFMGTFHALGVHIIRRYGDTIGVPRSFSILDKTASSGLIKEALKEAGYDPKQYEPRKIGGVISRHKGDLVSIEQYLAMTQGTPFAQVVADVWRRYQALLTKEKALDFDDLLGKTVDILRTSDETRRALTDRWRYIHIDEYQDTNKAQYTIARLLVGDAHNICAVGDTDQCLLPTTLIQTPTGTREISSLQAGDTVISAGGDSATCTNTVQQVKKRYYSGDLVTITTAKGGRLTTTPEHIIFAKLSLQSDIYYVYLMYRKDKGYRVGIVQGSRSSGNRTQKEEIGLQVRCNQEKASKMWVLRVCNTKEDALYWENIYATSYGLPQLVFLTEGRKTAMSQSTIDTFYTTIDTHTRAHNLMKELGLDHNHPHYTPQGTTQGNSEKNRINVRLTMFSDKRRSERHPWGLSRVSINTTNDDLKKNLEKSGFSIRKGKKTDWRMEMCRLDYNEAESIAQQLVEHNPDLILNRTALLTNKERFLMLPAGSLHRTMDIAYSHNDTIIEDRIVSIEKTPYTGNVYDLDVDKTHNYIANNIVVHNCVYSWRGANIQNILRFEKDYPATKIVYLEENYRSTATIIQAANEVISHNTMRQDKKLFTSNSAGEKLALYRGFDEKNEASFVAEEARRLIDEGVSPSEIAVLYRTNFQSRALEEAFLEADVPYQVLGTRFFERKEIKDIIALLKSALNPESLSDIKRIINVPPRGIGKVTLAKIFGGQRESLNASMSAKVDGFYRLLARIDEATTHKKPSELIRWLVREVGIDTWLANEGEEGKERLENIKELATLAVRYDEMPLGEGVERLLEDAALAADQDALRKEEHKEGVKLMTVHASKGLEFPYVFITGLEQGLFPSEAMGDSARGERERAEEERRLCYVAITRAGKKAYLTHAISRMIFGSRQMHERSTFIDNISPELIEECGGGDPFSDDVPRTGLLDTIYF